MRGSNPLASLCCRIDAEARDRRARAGDEH